MDNTNRNVTETYRQYVNRRAHTLKAEYPDSTPAERRSVLSQCEREYMTILATLPREATVALSVGRSLVSMIGHAEATRTLRHVANYPACLPIHTV
jgi:hypothetical protein